MASKNKIKVFLFGVTVVSLSLCSNAFAIEFDETSLSEDGKIHLSIVPPTTMTEKYEVNEMIDELAPGWGITSGGEWNCNEEITSCKLVYQGSDWTDDYIDIVYDYDAAVKEKVDKILEDFHVPEAGFSVNDTELLEYWVFGSDTLASFSSEVKSSLKNYNLDVNFKARGGGIEPLVSHNIGTVEISFGGTIYAVIGGDGFEPSVVAPHIFYVPSDTPEDGLADALKTRLAEIYGDEIMDIINIVPTNDKVSDLLEENGNFNSLFSNYLDKTAFELDIDFGGLGDSQTIVIVNDSEKIKEPSTINTTDLLTDINISIGSALLPDDAMIYAESFGYEQDEVIEEALGTKTYSIYEIGLYSPALDEEISDIEGDEFTVTIPIPENLKGIESLSAYWMNFETEEPEEHRTTISGDNAIFTTSHFSTYILAESTEVEEDEEIEGEDGSSSEEAKDGEKNGAVDENTTKSSNTGTFPKNEKGVLPILPIASVLALIAVGIILLIIKKVKKQEYK